MRARRTIRLRALLITALTLAAGTSARAEVGFAAFVASDDRVRGISLSDARPVFGATLTYDRPNGLYAGGSLIGVADGHEGASLFGYVGYAGWARRLANGASVDFGVSQTHGTLDAFQRRLIRRSAFDYSEAYAGLAGEHVNAHLYYSPNYLGTGIRTLYAELDAVARPAPRWRLFGHLGVLTPLEAGPYDPPRERYDLRAGGAVEAGRAELELAWAGTTPDTGYVAVYRASRGALVLAAKVFF